MLTLNTTFQLLFTCKYKNVYCIVPRKKGSWPEWTFEGRMRVNKY